MTQPFPYIPPLLLAELDRRFAELSPRKTETHVDLIWRGGQRSVVEFLKAQSTDQIQRAMETL